MGPIFHESRRARPALVLQPRQARRRGLPTIHVSRPSTQSAVSARREIDQCPAHCSDGPRSANGPPKCCTQSTITVSPELAGKIRQKHPYFSKEWHASYGRRTGVERSFALVKNPAVVDLRRGGVRVMGTTKTLLLHAIAYAAVNFRLLAAFERWRADPGRRRRKPRRRKLFTEALTNIRAAEPAAATANSPPAA